MADDESLVLSDYIDLTEGQSLEEYSIRPTGFDCEIVGSDNVRYRGFLLAKSSTGAALTVCDVNFQWSTKDSKYAPRLIFRRTNKDLEDKPINKGRRFQRIPFQGGTEGYRQFWQMIGFLAKFKEAVDLGEHFFGYKVVSKDSVVQDLKAKKLDDRRRAIVDYVIESGLTLEDMAGALIYKSRSDDLTEFKSLIDDIDDSRKEYRTKHDIKKLGDEVIFHHFLKNHQWIFGLSLDIKFIVDFADEASVGISNTDNQGDPQVDMLGWNDFTVLVELKTPDAKYFTATKASTARTNTWSFTPEFIDGYSQVLAQKDDWMTTHKNKDIIHENDGVKETIDQRLIRTVDPRVIFVYGHKEDEIPASSTLKDIQTKRDTLERFVRDHKNVSIISYDELYLRAHHIVHSKAPDAIVTEPEQSLDDIFDW